MRNNKKNIWNIPGDSGGVAGLSRLVLTLGGNEGGCSDSFSFFLSTELGSILIPETKVKNIFIRFKVIEWRNISKWSINIGDTWFSYLEVEALVWLHLFAFDCWTPFWHLYLTWEQHRVSEGEEEGCSSWLRRYWQVPPGRLYQGLPTFFEWKQFEVKFSLWAL